MNTESTPENAGEKQDGKFKKGQSGNPSGKPKGRRNRVTIACEELLEGQAEQLTQAVIDKALSGDGVALRLCLERIAPVPKGRRIEFDLPEIKTAADISDASLALLSAVSNGQVSPEEAGGIATLIEAARRSLETTELEGRIAVLEGK